MIGKIVRKFYRKIEYSKEFYDLRNRRRYWQNVAKKNYSKKINLSKKQISEINSFYKPYTKVNIIFHKFYYEKNGNFSVKYIPDDLYYTVIDPYYNNWNEAIYLDNKCYYNRIFSGILQPKTIVKRMNGVWYDENEKNIDISKARELLEERKSFFVKKATESEGGHGVFFIKDLKSLDEVIKGIKKDLIIQEPLKQSKTISKLNSSSVNTIRILTLFRNNKVKVYSSVIRMGINGAKVDNASSGGITCGIQDDGRLKEVGYASNGTRYTEHPSSKIKFNDIKIPQYNMILTRVQELAKTIPHFRLVSWDIAINEQDEPVLIEANLRYGELDFHQLNNGPIFGDDTEEILKEVLKNRRK